MTRFLSREGIYRARARVLHRVPANWNGPSGNDPRAPGDPLGFVSGDEIISIILPEAENILPSADVQADERKR